jgi:dTDP-4-dehydrorhamnose reductase
MIHISTDCVFDGKKGLYTENDMPAPEDLYGRTKLIGEVDYPGCVTLRTSIIGHELKGRHGLIEWFLREKGKVRGYTNAIYTGFPTIEFTRIIHNYVMPQKTLSGLYHVSSEPISKFKLLQLVAEKYGKSIDIEPYNDFVVDRSLESARFRAMAGYSPPSWPDMIDAMFKDYAANRDQYSKQ